METTKYVVTKRNGVQSWMNAEALMNALLKLQVSLASGCLDEVELLPPYTDLGDGFVTDSVVHCELDIVSRYVE